jgi:hypothetical protein
MNARRFDPLVESECHTRIQILGVTRVPGSLLETRTLTYGQTNDVRTV